MPTEVAINTGTLMSFCLVLTRMAGVFAFLPIPGAQNAPAAARIGCALGFTLALFPAWPALPPDVPAIGTTVWWMASEASLGCGLGLAVLLVAEAFTVAAQTISMQAGFSYASTIDPTNQTDAGLMPLMWQLLAGMLFFTSGLDLYLLRALGLSLSTCPPGRCAPSIATAERLIAFSGQMLVVGVRLALPVVAFLMLVDVLLALVTRVSSQLQLLSLAFPAKLLIALVLIMAVSPMVPTLYRSASERLAPVIAKMLHG